ncbi:TonB-dependent receptor [Algoriphagus aestuariicola]|uniref:TonB-dependent receptor n=1 Tax=Algoriphagus aestuariicola TaxID=1852016 RepID=A0ABS3BMC9_9BACT|nr:TonB-dependent receptor [Algoriphagus aestuariicola]MBN7800086.1 TonB-dependent receptor [Algoriphagus aestuariicola]
MEIKLQCLIKMVSKNLMYGFIAQCLFLTAAMAHGTKAQVKPIDKEIVALQKDSWELEELFKNLESKTDYKFVYTEDILKNPSIVQVKKRRQSVKDILIDIATSSNLKFKQVDNSIFVGENVKNTPSPAEHTVMDRVAISGTVKDAKGVPIPGVTIIISGTTTGTVTDIDGKFSLDAPQGSSLRFSFIGYEQQSIVVGNQTELEIILQEDTSSLEEVVVVGYGNSRKIDLTGAVSNLEMEDFELQPNVNFVQALRGTTAGVSVTDNGKVGSDGNIIIRGISSISGSNAPLIVLDGIPYYGGLSDINSNDIETIDILKDASSAAIYGSRAANGVIMITSKKGKNDKPKFNYNGYFGVSDFAFVPNSLGPDKYLKLKEDASAFTGRDLTQLNPLEEESLENGWTINPWEAIKQNAPMQNHELSISGSTEKVNYYLSGSYTNQSSPLYGDEFSRISGRVNLDIKVTDWLKVGTNTGYTVKDYSGNEADISAVNFLSPFSQLFDQEGQIYRLPMNDGLVVNPLFNAYQNQNHDVRNNLFSNIYAEVKFPIEGLSYMIRNGNTLLQNEAFNFNPSFNREGFNILASGSKSHGKTYNLVLENILKYEKSIAEDHNIDLTFLYGIESSNSNSSKLSSNNIFNDALGYHGLGIGENQKVETSAVESSAVSSMARFGYRFQEKYMFNFTIRRDGFSAFGDDKKYAVFPSTGASWVLSNEEFFDSNVIDILKLRFSYGKNGNRGVNPYASKSSIAVTQYVYGDGTAPSIGLYPTSFANPFLGWETTLGSNLGLDFGFFKSRINGSFEVYNNNTSDLLLQLSVPNVNGYSQFFSNVGKMKNKGIELTLNTVNIDKGGIQWNSTLIFSLNRNEIVELNGKEDDIASRRFIGHPLGTYFDYVFDGVWQEGDDTSIDPTAKPGYLRFKDIDGDGKITPDDRQIVGNNQSNFFWGITNSVQYKGLMFSFLVNGRVGGISPNSMINPGTNFYDRVNIIDLPYWTPENPLNDRPAVGYPNPYGYGFYQQRDYVRLQDVTLSYSLPSTLMSKLKLSQTRFYVSGKNLKTWTDWMGFDPEHGQAGTFNPELSGPLLRSIVFGFNITI